MSLSSLFNFLLFLIGFSLVYGCGLLPQGEVTAMTFTANGFTLSAEMVYSESPVVRNAITSISYSRDAAISVVRDSILSAVNDVLEEQGRNALLPNPVVSQILQQLRINVNYTPLECPTVTDKQTNITISAMKGGCFIIDNLVASLCTMDMIPAAGAGQQPMPGCTLTPALMNVEPIPARYSTLKGSLMTSNVIMANWTRQMWQSVLNKVSQRLASGRLGKYFGTAVVTVDG